MIYVKHNNKIKEVIEVYVGSKPISEIYNKDRLLYLNLLLICYANGYWIDEFPWNDNSYWMD